MAVNNWLECSKAISSSSRVGKFEGIVGWKYFELHWQKNGNRGNWLVLGHDRKWIRGHDDELGKVH